MAADSKIPKSKIRKSYTTNFNSTKYTKCFRSFRKKNFTLHECQATSVSMDDGKEDADEVVIQGYKSSACTQHHYHRTEAKVLIKNTTFSNLAEFRTAKYPCTGASVTYKRYAAM